MFQLDIGDRRPLYEQIKSRIKELIVSGVLHENDKIPSVRELAANLAINPNTIQKAYKDLENEGYIYSRPAKGNFAAAKPDAIENSVAFKDSMDSFDAVARELFYLGADAEELKRHIDEIFNRKGMNSI